MVSGSGGARIYLVDDHEMVRQGLRALLGEAGHDVVGDSGDITVALAELQQLAPDIVLVDLSIGARSGMELLAELQRRQLPCRPLVLTMSAQPRHVGMALKLGACGYVLKGSASAELLQAIVALRSGRRHLGEGVAELAAHALAQDDGADPFASLSVRERQDIERECIADPAEAVACSGLSRILVLSAAPPGGAPA